MTNEQCAVWYMHYGSARVVLFANEREAAGFAYELADSGSGAVTGVQFADGRLVKRDDWQALDDYEDEVLRSASARAANAPPPPPTRKVRDPFDGQSVSVDADDPAWLGVRDG